jgi:hypothetical protein
MEVFITPLQKVNRAATSRASFFPDTEGGACGDAWKFSVTHEKWP